MNDAMKELREAITDDDKPAIVRAATAIDGLASNRGADSDNKGGIMKMGKHLLIGIAIAGAVATVGAIALGAMIAHQAHRHVKNMVEESAGEDEADGTEKAHEDD